MKVNDARHAGNKDWASYVLSAYRIPTDFPESDGTIEWKATTLVLVEAPGGDQTGIGYTYADGATAQLINDMLAEVVKVAMRWRLRRIGWRWFGRSAIWVVRESHRWL